MKKSTLRFIKGAFLIGFLLLFGVFVFLLTKHQSVVVSEADITMSDDQPGSGQIEVKDLKRIGFRYENPDAG